jgi:transposase-like protein
LERYLHPHGLVCPRCGHSHRRLFRNQGHFPAYRCRACERYYTVLTGTVFAKTRQRPATLVLLLRGIAKGEPTARLARELGLSRKQLHTLRQRIQTNLNDAARMVENLACLYLIEVAQVGCILDRTISSCLQPEERS